MSGPGRHDGGTSSCGWCGAATEWRFDLGGDWFACTVCGWRISLHFTVPASDEVRAEGAEREEVLGGVAPEVLELEDVIGDVAPEVLELIRRLVSELEDRGGVSDG